MATSKGTYLIVLNLLCSIGGFPSASPSLYRTFKIFHFQRHTALPARITDVFPWWVRQRSVVSRIIVVVLTVPPRVGIRVHHHKVVSYTRHCDHLRRTTSSNNFYFHNATSPFSRQFVSIKKTEFSFYYITLFLLLLHYIILVYFDISIKCRLLAASDNFTALVTY